MAATTYYMLCRVADDQILEARLVDDFGVENYTSVMVVRSATFSEDAGDDPDVLEAEPLAGGTFVAPSTYSAPESPPADPYLKVDDWSESAHGSSDPDDGVWEMTAGSGNNCTLRVKKWDLNTDTAISEAGDKFEVCVLGGAKCPAAVLTLDSNGEATITFTPSSDEIGAVSIIFNGINVDYVSPPARLRLI